MLRRSELETYILLEKIESGRDKSPHACRLANRSLGTCGIALLFSSIWLVSSGPIKELLAHEYFVQID